MIGEFYERNSVADMKDIREHLTSAISVVIETTSNNVDDLSDNCERNGQVNISMTCEKRCGDD